jgi:flagellin-specific chaperone FliS
MRDFCYAFESIYDNIDSIKTDFEKNRIIKFYNLLCELKKIHTEAIEKKLEPNKIKEFVEKIKHYESIFEDLKARNNPLDTEIQKCLSGNLFYFGFLKKVFLKKVFLKKVFLKKVGFSLKDGLRRNSAFLAHFKSVLWFRLKRSFSQF